MKKDMRNCGGGGYPAYSMPIMPGMMPYQGGGNNGDQHLQEQVYNLERRVARLEGMIQTNMPNYSESNYYMV